MRVVAAMSGGVDSSVVAGLLVEQGHEVIGVHMKLHDVPNDPVGGSAKHCCGLDDALDARAVAAKLDIPFYVMDLRAAFKKAVMDDFADTYLRGATPNPCIQCNGVLKFRVLLARAKALGATHLATGHYARISEDGGLATATDAAKDQSYFLFPVTREALAHTLFPLGGMTKPEVRATAQRMGLLTADKPESQEVCFIPDDDHTRFVTEHRGVTEGAGQIVHIDGRVLGEHGGYWRYTIGQRRGLGVAVGHPLYVISINPTTAQVTVGPNEALRHTRIRAERANWFHRPEVGDQLLARIRHRGAMHPCEVVSVGTEGEVAVQLRTPARAATPGQAIVLYEGECVAGGAWIQDVDA